MNKVNSGHEKFNNHLNQSSGISDREHHFKNKSTNKHSKSKNEDEHILQQVLSDMTWFG